MPRKIKKQWVALVAVEFTGIGWRPIIIRDDDGEPHRFSSPDEIEQLSMKHPMGPGVWQAWNFTTGEVQIIG